MMGADFFLCAAIFVAGAALALFGIVEERKTSFLVSLSSAVCLLAMVAARRVYEVDDKHILRHAHWLRRYKFEKRPWADVKHVLVLDYRGETTPSILFEFKQGTAWELTIKRSDERKAIVDLARKFGVVVDEKAFY